MPNNTLLDIVFGFMPVLVMDNLIINVMKYTEFNTKASAPRLQLGEVTDELQNGRVHKLQARKIANDGKTVLAEGIIATFIPLDDIDVDAKGFVENAYLSSNGKWLVKRGQAMDTDDIGVK
jgi:hypothetical protein